MNSASPESTRTYPTGTSLAAKLLNVFVSPGLVFEEVVSTPPKAGNWLVPLVLVTLSSLVVLGATTDLERASAAIASLVETGKVTQAQATALSTHWRSIGAVTLCVGAFAGTAWSAFLIWFIGRVFLKTRFTFQKALEVASLSATILVLGAIVTWLLGSATGDTSARPSLSMFDLKIQPGSSIRIAAGLLDCFHLWATAVLAIGLSRLAGVTVKESVFWVFGYWFFFKMALVLLA